MHFISYFSGNNLKTCNFFMCYEWLGFYFPLQRELSMYSFNIWQTKSQNPILKSFDLGPQKKRRGSEKETVMYPGNLQSSSGLLLRDAASQRQPVKLTPSPLFSLFYISCNNAHSPTPMEARSHRAWDLTNEINICQSYTTWNNLQKAKGGDLERQTEDT